MSEKVDKRLLSQAMLLDGMYPGIVEKWAAQVAALESELAEAQTELEGFRAFKRGVDEALNSGDGAYRP